MLFLTYALVAITSAAQPPNCARLSDLLAGKRVFTNADLEQISACRYQTGVDSQGEVRETDSKEAPRPARTDALNDRGDDRSEADWRARWRSVDQRVRKLRREAHELRLEAAETTTAPPAQAGARPKQQPKGRRSPALLLSRARALEMEARELEDEFQERARREGVLPGWIRPQGR